MAVTKHSRRNADSERNRAQRGETERERKRKKDKLISSCEQREYQKETPKKLNSAGSRLWCNTTFFNQFLQIHFN